MLRSEQRQFQKACETVLAYFRRTLTFSLYGAADKSLPAVPDTFLMQDATWVLTRSHQLLLLENV